MTWYDVKQYEPEDNEIVKAILDDGREVIATYCTDTYYIINVVGERIPVRVVQWAFLTED